MSNCFWSKSFCIRHPVSYGTSSSLKSISFTRRLVGCNSEGCRIARATITRSNLPLFSSLSSVVRIVALLLLQKRNNSRRSDDDVGPIQSVCRAKGARRKTQTAAFKRHSLSLRTIKKSIFSHHHHSRSGAFLRASVEYMYHSYESNNSFSSEVVTPELGKKFQSIEAGMDRS